MPTTMLRVRVHVQNDPELTPFVGDGAKRFIGWKLPDDSVRLFYTPNLLLFPPISAERFKEMKAQVEEEPISNPQKHIDAIKNNRSMAQTNKLWDGGDNAMRIIDRLLGRDVPEDAFNDSGDAVAQEAAPKLPLADYKPAKGDRVKRLADEAEGTVTEGGAEQSEVKWDESGFTGYEANINLTKIETKKDEGKMATAAAKKKTTTAKKKTTTKPAAKPAKAPRAIKWPEGKLNWLVDENPRRAGTRAHEVVGKTMKLGKVTLEEANKKTGYTLIDFEFDKKRKHVELKK